LRPAPAPKPAPVLSGVALGSSALFVVALLVLMAWPVPRHVRLSPGPSPDVGALIKVEGAPSYVAKSRLGLALVIVAPADNLFELARSKLDSTSEVFRRNQLIPDDTSDQENDKRNANLMTSSQEDATYVALKYLGFDVKATGKGARVTRVLDGLPAAGILAKGDVITAVDGRPVVVSDEAVKLVVARAVGMPVRLGIDRNGQMLELEVVTTASPEDAARPIVGVTLETADPSYELPPGLKIQIDAEGIGGPSAGLIYTLGIIDVLTPDDITGGTNVAATGEIRLDGSVGPIGGLREKAVGVERAGAKYFLVPAGDNFEEARKAATKMQVVPVSTLQEALDLLKGLRGGADLVLPPH
jgi:PDZ domain-containing protein